MDVKKNKEKNEDSIWRGIYWRKKYNTVKGELDTLKEAMTEDIFKKIMEKVGEPLENKRLREDNKRLRLKVKELKEERNDAIAELSTYKKGKRK